MTLRNRIDTAFGAWGRMVSNHGFIALVLSLFVIGGLARQLPDIRVENSSEAYLHSDDPASIAYEAFQRQFGQDDRLLVAIETSDVFDLQFLEQLRAFQDELEESLPHLDEITSLINVRETRGEEETLIVEDLLETWPQNEADLADLRDRVMANPLYVDNVVARNGRMTTLSIEPVVYTETGDAGLDALAAFDAIDESESAAGDLDFLHEEEKKEMVEMVWAVAARHQAPDFKIHITGAPVVAVTITNILSHDSKVRMGGTALASAFLLVLLFRRISGVVFPLLVVFASLVSTMGSMALMDVPFTIVLGMLPIFTMCVGVCNSVHVMVLVYQGLEAGKTRGDAVEAAFYHAGLAIFMTGLTTAAGLASFLSADLATVKSLGQVAPFGVLFAFIYSMTLLPALIGIFPLSPKPRGGTLPGGNLAERILVSIGGVAAGRPVAVLGVSAVVVLAIGVGIFQTRFSHEPLKWLPEDHESRVASELIDEHLRGASTTEVVIDTGRENGLQDPAVLLGMKRAIEEVEGLDRGILYVGKATSLIDIVQETHQALNRNDPAFYDIPRDPQLVAQELLLFENSGSDDLERVTDSQFRTGRVTLRMPAVDAILYEPYLMEIQSIFQRALGPDVAVSITGRNSLSSRTFSAMIVSMARSYMVAFAVITPLMMLLIGNIRLGLISMIPNLLPVFLTLALMGLLDWSIDASSIVIGSIIIGLAVDDTIHFLHRYQGEVMICDDSRLAVERTMRTTGSALLFTSLVLASGFVVMGSSSIMHNSIVFGYVTAAGIGIAFVADILITPALIVLAMPDGAPTGKQGAVGEIDSLTTDDIAAATI